MTLTGDVHIASKVPSAKKPFSITGACPRHILRQFKWALLPIAKKSMVLANNLEEHHSPYFFHFSTS